MVHFFASTFLFNQSSISSDTRRTTHLKILPCFDLHVLRSSFKTPLLAAAPTTPGYAAHPVTEERRDFDRASNKFCQFNNLGNLRECICASQLYLVDNLLWSSEQFLDTVSCSVA